MPTFDQGMEFLTAVVPVILLWLALRDRFKKQDASREARLKGMETRILSRMDGSDLKVEQHHTANLRRFSRIDMALYKAGLIAHPTDSSDT